MGSYANIVFGALCGALIVVGSGSDAAAIPFNKVRVANCPTAGDAQQCLQNFFNSGAASDTYYIPPGTYTHSGALFFQGHVVGAGAGVTTLFGSDPANRAIATLVSGSSLAEMSITGANSVRYTTPQSTAVYVGATVTGFEVSYLEVYGDSGSAGIFVFGGASGKIHHNYVHNTNADCIHNTQAAHDIEIWANVMDHCGDDSVAMVGSSVDGMPYNINIHNNTVTNQDWGRGYSCVGARNSVIANNHFSMSSGGGAGIYAASEPNNGGVPCHDLVISGNTLKNAGNVRLGQSAILLANAAGNANFKNITVSGNLGYQPPIGWFIGLLYTGMSAITVTNNATYQDIGGVVYVGSPVAGLTNTKNAAQPSAHYPGDAVPADSAAILAGGRASLTQ
jgi:Right handed beta helix region